MKMTKLEKLFVNTQRHAQGNIRIVEQMFRSLSLQNIKTVLEIGCGVGMLTEYLAQQYNMKVMGTDVDPDQIEIARRNNLGNENLSFGVESATSLSCENQQFDMVLCFKVLHHINNWTAALQQVARVLKPGGYFLLSDFAYTNLGKRVLSPLAKNYGIYTKDDVVEQLAELNIVVKYQMKAMGLILFKPCHMLFQKATG